MWENGNCDNGLQQEIKEIADYCTELYICSKFKRGEISQTFGVSGCEWKTHMYFYFIHIHSHDVDERKVLCSFLKGRPFPTCKVLRLLSKTMNPFHSIKH